MSIGLLNPLTLLLYAARWNNAQISSIYVNSKVYKKKLILSHSKVEIPGKYKFGETEFSGW